MTTKQKIEILKIANSFTNFSIQELIDGYTKLIELIE